MSGSEFQPISDAFAAADMIAAAPPAADPPPPVEPPAGAPEPVDQEYLADVRAIRAAAKRSGKAFAHRLGRAMEYSVDEIEAMLRPKPKKPKETPPPEDAGDTPPTEDAPKPAEGGGGGGWKLAKDPIKKLPEDCPVRPLGRSGDIYFYLDPLNQLRELVPSDHSAMGLRGLFCDEAGMNFLWRTWPKFSAATGNQSGWQADRSAESMMAACSNRGVFDAHEKVRGSGAWRGPDGTLVLHAGDAIWTGGEWKKPGEHDGYLYPAFPPAPRAADTAEGWIPEATYLLDLLDTWNWREEDGEYSGMKPLGHRLQSLLVFGWIGLAIIGGALDWRALIWLTGDAGSGKSALLDLIRDIIGMLVKSADATPAGVRAVLGQSTQPVLLDEVENDPNSRKNADLVKLARIASSGDQALRSSADHKSHATEVRSAFLFSSIIIPPMFNQDVSRFAVLDLAPHPGGKPLDNDVPRRAKIGRLMRRRIIDGWHRWPAVLEAWRATLTAAGHDARGSSQFGALLAMVDLLLRDDGFDSDSREELATLVSGEAVAAKQTKYSDAESMLNFITSVPLDVFRGGTRMTIGTLVSIAAVVDGKVGEGIASPQACVDALIAHGVFVDGMGREARVILPNQHEGLRRLFDASRWRTEPGATRGWAQAMRRLAEATNTNSRKHGGRGWSVPARVFLMLEEEKKGNG